LFDAGCIVDGFAGGVVGLDVQEPICVVGQVGEKVTYIIYFLVLLY